jgi:hypothetical protein
MGMNHFIYMKLDQVILTKLGLENLNIIIIKYLLIYLNLILLNYKNLLNYKVFNIKYKYQVGDNLIKKN